jgi:hypothetical protein
VAVSFRHCGRCSRVGQFSRVEVDGRFLTGVINAWAYKVLTLYTFSAAGGVL